MADTPARALERAPLGAADRAVGAVLDHNPKHIQLDVDALQTRAFDWERAMRKLVRCIPGGDDE